MEHVERLAQVAGVRRQHDVAAWKPDAEGLVAGGMAVGRQAGDAAVTEQVVLAVDQLAGVTEIVVARVIAILRAQVGIGGRLPLAALHDERRVGKLRIAADVIEVQMRVDQPADRVGFDTLRAQARTQFLARSEVDPVDLREETESRFGVGLGVEVQARVEDDGALRMQHQPTRDRHANRPGGSLEEEPEVALEPAAGKREEPDRHRGRR